MTDCAGQACKLSTTSQEGRITNAVEQAPIGYLHPYVQIQAQTMSNLFNNHNSS